MITKILGLLSEWLLLPLIKDFILKQLEKRRVEKENKEIDKIIKEKYDEFEKSRSIDDFDKLP